MTETIVNDLVGIRFDLLSVCIAIAAMFLLGCIIYLSDRRSMTNRAFALFALINVIWGISNYLEYKFPTITETLWALRIHLFISCGYALLFFRLAYIFPSRSTQFPKWYYRSLLPLLGVTAIVTLTPLVFSSIAALAPAGEVTNPSRGPGILLFAIVAFGMLFAGAGIMWRKARREPDATLRSQLYLVFVGLAATAVLILTFNVLLPIFFNQLGFIPLAALFMLPFVALISYAINQHELFNVKVGAAGALVFVIAIANLMEIVLSSDITVTIFAIGTLILVLLAGALLIQSVLREIQQRETIERQEKELEAINAQQENLLHFISHEIKGYLAKSEAGFAAITEGDFGEVAPQLKEMASTALSDVRRGVRTVMDILDASNLKKGTVAYNKAPFDLKATVLSVVDELRSSAEEKQLHLETVVPPTGAYTINGDEEKLRHHVIRNLIDNSIKYTPSGSVTVGLSRTGDVLRFTVEDTGVGITEEDKKRLFTEGGHGKDSIRVNIHSTGYGLYIAKQVVEAHGGKIWAESDGAGKGSRFIAELPAAS